MDYAYNAPAPTSAEEKRARRERRKKLRGGDRNKQTIFVAYAWSERRMSWLLLGFSVRSSTTITPKYVEKLRTRYAIPNGVCMRVVELFVAAHAGPGTDPFYSTRR
jgi:hypothetical protein